MSGSLELNSLAFRDLLDSIAAKSPTPGGGAVAAITSALAAALARMVVNYSIGRKSLSGHENGNRAALQRLQALGESALRLAEQDAKAYGSLNELWKLDAADERRRRELPTAVAAAIRPPQQMLEESLDMLRSLKSLVATTNPNLKSDLAIAAILAEAAARAAAWNVRINLPLLGDPEKQADLRAALSAELAEAARLCRDIDAACQSAQ